MFHTGFEDREEGNQKRGLIGAEGEESFKERLVSSIECSVIDSLDLSAEGFGGGRSREISEEKCEYKSDFTGLRYE